MSMREAGVGKRPTVARGGGMWYRCAVSLLMGAGAASAVAQSNTPTDYNFAYQLSGDRRVAALQVFDDGRDTWLQFAPEQPLPALFTRVRNAQGGEHEQLAVFRQQGPYLVVAGLNTRVSMRIGHVIAHADYLGQPGRQAPLAAPAGVGRGSVGASSPIVPPMAADASSEAALPVGSAGDGAALPVLRITSTAPTVSATTLAPRQRDDSRSPDAVSALPVAHQPLASRSTAQRLSVTAPPTSAVRSEKAESPSNPAASPAQPAAAVGLRASAQARSHAEAMVPVTTTVSKPAGVPSSGLRFEAAPADLSMRQALSRWAKAAGWTFAAEHWTVPVDIPLTGSASFGGDFKSAVRDLLAATELAEQPLQPCFYANQVLRVVPLPEACDRTAGERRPSTGAVL